MDDALTAARESAITKPLQPYDRGCRYGERFESTAPAASPAITPAGTASDNPLEAYFDAHREGPGIWKWRHYFDIYHRHFARFIGRPLTVLEVGVYSGGSLAMWLNYFGPECRIYGVDILEQCREFEGGSARVLIGNQGDRGFWRQVREDVPNIDIIIDDGSHFPEHQIVTLEEVIPHLAAGGVYLCEDVYRRQQDFRRFVHGLSDVLSDFGPPCPGIADFHDGMAVNGLQRHVHSIHQYPFVTVIEKAALSVEELTAPR